jgi:hypothetical protein
VNELNESELRVGFWNVGGISKNHPHIFRACKDIDIMCFAETFLESETMLHLRVPSSMHVLHIPGVKKYVGAGGRASGGFSVLIRNSVAKPGNCSLVQKSPGLCVLQVTLVSGQELVVVIAYRADDPKSAVYDPHFHASLFETLVEFDDKETLLVGDFNTKMGDMSGPLGLFDFAVNVLPQSSESQDVDEHACDLLEVLTNTGMYAIYDERTGTVRDTFQCRKGDGGSLIDMVFANANLYVTIDRVECQFHAPLNHALLVINMSVGHVPRTVKTNNAVSRTVRRFDLDKLEFAEHSDEMLQLASSPEGFSVQQACNVIWDFVRGFTTEVTINVKEEKPNESRDTVEARRDARRIERRLKVEKDNAVRAALRRDWIVSVDCWRACRDRDIQLTVNEARQKYYEALKNRDLYRAWRIARRNLCCKGGGIREKVTSYIDWGGWEDHFANLFSGTGATLQSPRNGKIDPILDEPFSADEVAAALDRKQTHRALGPDGFVLDHVRVLRYDPVTSKALANLMNICVSCCDVPASWGHAYLCVLYKGSGPKDNANNFRGITLKSQLLKLLESLM